MLHSNNRCTFNVRCNLGLEAHIIAQFIILPHLTCLIELISSLSLASQDEFGVLEEGKRKSLWTVPLQDCLLVLSLICI